MMRSRMAKLFHTLQLSTWQSTPCLHKRLECCRACFRGNLIRVQVNEGWHDELSASVSSLDGVEVLVLIGDDDGLRESVVKHLVRGVVLSAALQGMVFCYTVLSAISGRKAQC